MSSPGARSRSAAPRPRSSAADRAAERARARVIEDIERLCADAGISLAALARAAAVPYPFLWRVMHRRATPSIETYAKLAGPLGADLSLRLYPNTGPTIRDRHQARILEGLIAQRHRRWEPFTEVAVRAPARGYIDAVLHERRDATVVATEIQSELRRIEQVVRWSMDKAESLPSWVGWSALMNSAHGGALAGVGDGALAGPSDRAPAISRLLLVRRTRATRDVAKAFAGQLRVAYPAHPDDAIAALVGTAPWPGPALVWVAVEAGQVRLLSGR